MMEYSNYIHCGMDDSIYTLDDAKEWYTSCIDDLKDDYPTFDDYYDSLFDMGEYNNECQKVDSIHIDGYEVYVYGDTYCITKAGNKKIIFETDNINDITKENIDNY